jgi:hypothetical protein
MLIEHECKQIVTEQQLTYADVRYKILYIILLQ